MAQVKFGLIGCGNAGGFHVMSSKENPEASVKYVAVHDVNDKALARFSRLHKLTPYSELDKFLASDIDAVLLAVPHYLHATLEKRVAESGKHILCEKPMATTLEECDQMIAAANKASVKFMIAENHRFLPAHKLVKQAVEDGLIGDVFLGRAYEGAFVPSHVFLDADNWQFTFDKGGGGVVADQGCHKFATLNWMLGEVDKAQCWLGKALNSPPNKGEDNAIVLLRYKNGAMITVDVSSVTSHPLTNRMELHGTRGTVLEDHAWDNPVSIFSSHEKAQVKGEFYSPKVEHGAYPKYYLISAREEDAHFAQCILNDQPPEFTPEQAKQAIAVTLLSYLSAKKGTPASMSELATIAKTKGGTKSILDGLDKAIQRNCEMMHWP